MRSWQIWRCDAAPKGLISKLSVRTPYGREIGTGRKFSFLSQEFSKIVNRRLPILVALGLATALLVPAARAQKPPAPPPPPSGPPSPSPTHPVNNVPMSSQPGQPEMDFVMYLQGRVATDDGTRLPSDVMIERVCSAAIRQQVYASPGGDFSMHLGAITDSALDATAAGTSQPSMPGKFTDAGIPRHELAICELRATVSGYESRSVNLASLSPSNKNVDVGVILLHSRTKVAGTTVDAAAYKAPKDAGVAYQKGVDAQTGGKLANARKYFERAVAVYPAYAHAWFQLGLVLEKQNEKDAARIAYTRATAANAGFLPPYVSLARMALEAGNWSEVLRFTGPILALDPFKDLTGYTMELDAYNSGDAYFYNAVANYRLHNFADAERSALKAEHSLVRSTQLHLLLGQIFARKKDHPSAISEIQMYLELVPDAQEADRVRQWLAELRERNDFSSPTDKNQK